MEEAYIPYRLKVGDNIKIIFKDPNSNDKTEKIKCFATIIAIVFGANVGIGSLFVVSNKQDDIAQFAVPLNQNFSVLKARVKITWSENSVKRQIDPMNRLCGVIPGYKYLAKWQKLLLNQSMTKEINS